MTQLIKQEGGNLPAQVMGHFDQLILDIREERESKYDELVKEKKTSLSKEKYMALAGKEEAAARQLISILPTEEDARHIYKRMKEGSINYPIAYNCFNQVGSRYLNLKIVTAREAADSDLPSINAYRAYRGDMQTIEALIDFLTQFNDKFNLNNKLSNGQIKHLAIKINRNHGSLKLGELWFIFETLEDSKQFRLDPNVVMDGIKKYLENKDSYPRGLEQHYQTKESSARPLNETLEFSKYIEKQYGSSKK